MEEEERKEGKNKRGKWERERDELFLKTKNGKPKSLQVMHAGAYHGKLNNVIWK